MPTEMMRARCLQDIERKEREIGELKGSLTTWGSQLRASDPAIARPGGVCEEGEGGHRCSPEDGLAAGAGRDPVRVPARPEGQADVPSAVLDYVCAPARGSRQVRGYASDRYLAEGATLDALRQTDGTLGYSPDLRHGVTGKGLNDYHTIFRILAEHRYQGWVSIEDGMNGLDEMAESLAFLRRMSSIYFPG